MGRWDRALWDVNSDITHHLSDNMAHFLRNYAGNSTLKIIIRQYIAEVNAFLKKLSRKRRIPFRCWLSLAYAGAFRPYFRFYLDKEGKLCYTPLVYFEKQGWRLVGSASYFRELPVWCKEVEIRTEITLWSFRLNDFPSRPPRVRPLLRRSL
jgi:hypothetical protein